MTDWKEKLAHRFPKEDKKKEREHDARVLSKEESWEFEKALRERLKTIREDCLREAGIQ